MNAEIDPMCQAYESERSFLVGSELSEIREIWRRHQVGEAPLTEEQIRQLAIRKMVLEER